MKKRMEIPAPQEKLDARGRRGSQLGMAIARKLASMETGSVLEVLTDDPAAPSEMDAWCRRTGHALLSVDALGDDQHLRIRRGA